MGKEYPPGFEELWKIYPRRDGDNPKRPAFKAWKARIKSGLTEDFLIQCAKTYAECCRKKGKEGTEFVLMCATFLGPNERWKAYEPSPVVKAPENGSKRQPEPMEERPLAPEEAKAFVRELIAGLAKAKSQEAR